MINLINVEESLQNALEIIGRYCKHNDCKTCGLKINDDTCITDKDPGSDWSGFQRRSAFFWKAYVVPDHDRNNFLLGRSAFGMHCCRDLVPSLSELTDVVVQAVAANPTHLAPLPVTETA